MLKAPLSVIGAELRGVFDGDELITYYILKKMSNPVRKWDYTTVFNFIQHRENVTVTEISVASKEEQHLSLYYSALQPELIAKLILKTLFHVTENRFSKQLIPKQCFHVILRITNESLICNFLDPKNIFLYLKCKISGNEFRKQIIMYVTFSG